MPLLDPVALRPLLGAYAGRFDVDTLAICDSTSSELLRRADAGAPSGSVLVADAQTAGRGRRGRNWLSAPADSLTFSLLWRFPGSPLQLSGLSLAVGVALARALAGLGAHGVGLKWPNDVLLRRAGEFAKLAGILIEMASDRRGTQVVIGVGLNLRAPDAVPGQPAAGLVDALASGELPERHVLFAALLVELAQVLDAFTVDGFAGQKNEWLRWHAWQDEPVRVVEDGRELLAGTCIGADLDGSLLVRGESGVERVLAGDVSLRHG